MHSFHHSVAPHATVVADLSLRYKQRFTGLLKQQGNKQTNVIRSHDFADELHAKRTLGLRKLGSLGLLLAGCSFVAIIIGAASIGVQASNPSPPYMLGTALIAGVLVSRTQDRK